MNFLIRFLWERGGYILAQAAFVLIFAVSFALYHLPLAAVMYPAGLCLLLGVLLAVSQIQKAYRKHEALAVISSHSGAVIPDELSPFQKTEDEDYRRIIEHLCGEIQSFEEQTAISQNEMMDYFTTWVHQIKTPIASMRLHLKTKDTPLSRKLLSDLLHIEQYVEMVLTYLRMGTDATDYVFREILLDDVLRENIRKLRGDFIVKNLVLRYEPTGAKVMSDEKWLSFVIGQILSNALKYTNSGTVTVSMEQPETLCISDTGIGVAPEDIPRLFEKGYTGYNGRLEKRASGLGLYLCKRVCDRLGHSISLTSVLDVGTEVRIRFHQFRAVRD